MYLVCIHFPKRIVLNGPNCRNILSKRIKHSRKNLRTNPSNILSIHNTFKDTVWKREPTADESMMKWDNRRQASAAVRCDVKIIQVWLDQIQMGMLNAKSCIREWGGDFLQSLLGSRVIAERATASVSQNWAHDKLWSWKMFKLSYHV